MDLLSSHCNHFDGSDRAFVGQNLAFLEHGMGFTRACVSIAKHYVGSFGSLESLLDAGKAFSNMLEAF